MSQQELLIEVVRTLQRLEIPAMVTGSHASSIQGEVRFTHDVDVVVALEMRQLPGLLQSFPAPRFYVSETAATEAVRNRRTFNVIEPATGDKIDFYLLKDTPFDRIRFDRRITNMIAGQAIPVSTPEDTIVQKLRWSAASGGSEKHLLDAVGVYEVQADRLDMAYIEHWVRELGLAERWQSLLELAEPFDPTFEP
jgi:hypothetical protein